MKTQNRNYLIAAAVAAVLIAGTAVASSYVTKQSIEAKETTQEKPKKLVTVTHPLPGKKKNQEFASAQPAPVPRCDDGNVLGTVVGGVGGGIVGSQVGKGHGNTAATIGGTLGGAYLGNQYIPLKNATCRQ
jgi:uncharacterized protein YcfJ